MKYTWGSGYMETVVEVVMFGDDDECNWGDGSRIKGVRSKGDTRFAKYL